MLCKGQTTCEVCGAPIVGRQSCPNPITPFQVLQIKAQRSRSRVFRPNEFNTWLGNTSVEAWPVARIGREVLGVDEQSWQEFISFHNLPPACSEKRYWWYKALEAKFGPTVAAIAKPLLFP